MYRRRVAREQAAYERAAKELPGLLKRLYPQSAIRQFFEYVPLWQSSSYVPSGDVVTITEVRR